MIFLKKNVLAMIELMEKHQIGEFSLRNWFTRVEIKRYHSLCHPAHHPSESDKAPAWAGPAAAPVDPPPAVQFDPEPESASEKYFQVQAPLVGTFYRAPAPDAEPFVEVGDQVSAGDTLCIVEAMKSMNEIQSDISGVIREICAKNGTLVEFGQTMFKIEENAENP